MERNRRSSRHERPNHTFRNVVLGGLAIGFGAAAVKGICDSRRRSYEEEEDDDDDDDDIVYDYI